MSKLHDPDRPQRVLGVLLWTALVFVLYTFGKHA
jgi:hypothetical protein